MRPYANWFLVTLLKCHSDVNSESKSIVASLIKVPKDGGDHQLGNQVTPKFFGDGIETRALVWLKRLRMLQNSNKLVR